MSRVFLLFLVVLAFPIQAHDCKAQQPAPAQVQPDDFFTLLERWRQPQDTDETIALGERLLALENKVAEWPAGLDPRSAKADIRFGVGSALVARATGSRADNLETAIAHLQSAVALWSRDTAPESWAMAHNNLGMAYWARIKGQRADNQDKAAAHFETALTVFSREATPLQWAQLQNNLAVMYWTRMRGERADNIEEAIQRFEAALTVFTRSTHQHRWAAAHNNLGSAYRLRIRGERADNREKAIGYLKAALSVFTRETFPLEWAQAQNNLAICYIDRIRGDGSDNREKAIGAFEGALMVFTRDTQPQEWAHAQHNLGIAYAGRANGSAVENRTKAISVFEAALQVFSRDADPRQHLRTSRLLARTLAEGGEWHKAAPHFASAREAFLLLVGEGLDEADTRGLIADAGPMFAEAALAAVHRNEPGLALEVASEGRARLLATALKLNTLKVDERARQRIDELRRSIRAAQRAAELAEGIERDAAIARVVGLRQQLLELLKQADASGNAPGSALAKVRPAIAGGGALVVPVITDLGASVLVVSGPPGQESIDVIRLAADTSEKLFVLLRGPRTDPNLSGWLGAYFINHLQGDELNRRWPEWLAAVDTIGSDLWHLFGGRLTAFLKAKKLEAGSRLVFLPPGDLGVLPLGLAQDPASKRRLIDDYEIVYAPSLDALAAAQSRGAEPLRSSLAVIINPTGDLPGTENEGDLVASYFSAEQRTILRRENATVERVLAALKGKTHWHFASHGTFSWQDARSSALVMHGMDLLSVGRLLETEGLGRPRLVVLSACETGLYDLASNPDEFIGLPATFAGLGAAGVMGTLWPVSDAATALLVAKFYDFYLHSNLPPPTALRRAQIWLRGATLEHLERYAEALAVKGRLERGQLDHVRRSLHKRSQEQSGASSLERPPAKSHGKVGKDPNSAKAARPYAHPYFWAGFVYSGL